MKTKVTRHSVEGVKSSDGTQSPPLLGGIQVRKSITLACSRAELYNFWRNFENLPRFMVHLESVIPLNEGQSRWTVRGPANRPVTYDAIILEDIPDTLISWRSIDPSDIDNAGSVHFSEAIAGRGTVLTVVLTYNPPAGKLGGWIAHLFGEEPSQQLSQDLRRFKALMETGEIPTSDMRRHDAVQAGLGGSR